MSLYVGRFYFKTHKLLIERYMPVDDPALVCKKQPFSWFLSAQSPPPGFYTPDPELLGFPNYDPQCSTEHLLVLDFTGGCHSELESLDIRKDFEVCSIMPIGADPEPVRYELFLLGDGEKKVSWQLDTRVPNTATFTFNKEDHTLGNLLSMRLHKYAYVSFSAYIIPHPLVPSFDLRVTTDGTVTPKEAIVNACRDIVQDLDVLSREFTKEWELKKIANMASGN